jgi:hypothetical protein
VAVFKIACPGIKGATEGCGVPITVYTQEDWIDYAKGCLHCVDPNFDDEAADRAITEVAREKSLDSAAALYYKQSRGE